MDTSSRNRASHAQALRKPSKIKNLSDLSSQWTQNLKSLTSEVTHIKLNPFKAQNFKTLSTSGRKVTEKIPGIMQNRRKNSKRVLDDTVIDDYLAIEDPSISQEENLRLNKVLSRISEMKFDEESSNRFLATLGIHVLNEDEATPTLFRSFGSSDVLLSEATNLKDIVIEKDSLGLPQSREARTLSADEVLSQSAGKVFAKSKFSRNLTRHLRRRRSLKTLKESPPVDGVDNGHRNDPKKSYIERTRSRLKLPQGFKNVIGRQSLLGIKKNDGILSSIVHEEKYETPNGVEYKIILKSQSQVRKKRSSTNLPTVKETISQEKLVASAEGPDAYQTASDNESKASHLDERGERDVVSDPVSEESDFSNADELVEDLHMLIDSGRKNHSMDLDATETEVDIETEREGLDSRPEGGFFWKN